MTANHEEAVAALRVAGYLRKKCLSGITYYGELSAVRLIFAYGTPAKNCRTRIMYQVAGINHVDTHRKAQVFVFLERHELQRYSGGDTPG